MNIVNRIVFLIVVIFPILFTQQQALATSNSPEPNPSKVSWLENVQKNLPIVLCQEDKYFVHCFDQTPKECVDSMTLFVQACLNNVSLGLPSNIDSQQGEYWGKVVSRCSYDLYEKYQHHKKHTRSECQDSNETQSELDVPEVNKP